MLKNLLNSIFFKKKLKYQDMLGISISNDYISIIQLIKKKQRWSLLKISDEYLDENSEDKEKATIELLKKIKLKQKFNTNNVSISIPTNSATIKVLSFPLLNEEELTLAASNEAFWENSVNLEGNISDYSIAYQTIKRDLEKNTMSILFVASHFGEIEKKCDLLRQAAFNPIIIDARCFALANSLDIYNESNLNQINAFIEISGEDNYIMFIYDNTPFVYNILLSENELSELRSKNTEISEDLLLNISSQIKSYTRNFIEEIKILGIEKLNFVSTLSCFNILFKGLKRYISEFKIELYHSFDQIDIPTDDKKYFESKKNLSSLTVASSLALRQLNIFDNSNSINPKFNINLIPNRENIIENEKKKINMFDTTYKLNIVNLAILITSLIIYSYFLLTIPSDQDIALLNEKLVIADNDLAKITTKYEEAKKWADSIGGLNNKVFDVNFLQSIPAGIFIVDLNQKRTGISEVNLKTIDPTLINIVIIEMNKTYKNVKLLGVESVADNDTFKTFKINYEMK